MPSVRIWTPESDYDRDAVCQITQKILKYYNCDLEIQYLGKQTYNNAVIKKQQDGLKKEVDTYLKRNDLVIFLIDADSSKSQAKRRGEKNSQLNRIEGVVNTSNGKVKLILMRQELEAWLLVDVLGICCYFTKNSENRNNQDWIKFARRKQPGKTNLIEEAEIGGKNAKEYLVELSREILIKNNPNLRNKGDNLKSSQYSEDQSPKIAQYIEINRETINRNDSLAEFAQCLKQLAETENSSDE
ncbi:MAG: hypothetical protein U7127_17675 [Phormidium sp.]